MRRWIIGVVVLGIVLAAGLASAQESGQAMPAKVRAFLDKMTGSWSRIDEGFKAEAQLQWDSGKSALLDRGRFQEGNITGSWSELWFWDGTSDNGIVSYWSVSSNQGLSHGKLHGRILSDTLLAGDETEVTGGKEATSSVAIEFRGSGRVTWKETNRIIGDERKPDLTETYVVAKPTSDEQELIRLQQEWCSAEMAGDARKVDRLLADEYVLTLSDGTALPKAEYLRDIQSEDTRSTALTVENSKVRLYGDMALVKGIVKWTEPGGKKHEDLFSETWLRRDGRWQCLATQESQIPKRVDSAKLSPEMKKLAVFVGTWRYKGEQVDPPVAGLPYGGAGKFHGTDTRRFVLDGCFMESTIEDNNPSGQTTVVSLTGYDPKARHYVVNGFMNDGTRNTSTETVSADGRIWTTLSTMTTSDGDTVPVRTVTTFSPDGTRMTSTTEVSPDGGTTWKHWYKDASHKVED